MPRSKTPYRERMLNPDQEDAAAAAPEVIPVLVSDPVAAPAPVTLDDIGAMMGTLMTQLGTLADRVAAVEAKPAPRPAPGPLMPTKDGWSVGPDGTIRIDHDPMAAVFSNHAEVLSPRTPRSSDDLTVGGDRPVVVNRSNY